MAGCASRLNLEEILSFYWSARQIVTCGRLYLNDLQILMTKDQNSTFIAEMDTLEQYLIAMRADIGF